LINLCSIDPANPLAGVGIYRQISNVATIEPLWPDWRGGCARVWATRACQHDRIPADVRNTVRRHSLRQVGINRANNQRRYAPGCRVNPIVDDSAKSSARLGIHDQAVPQSVESHRNVLSLHLVFQC
jgi:hypothetical protein